MIIAEKDPEPSRTSKMKLFAKVVNGWKLLRIVEEKPIIKFLFFLWNEACSFAYLPCKILVGSISLSSPKFLFAFKKMRAKTEKGYLLILGITEFIKIINNNVDFSSTSRKNTSLYTSNIFIVCYVDTSAKYPNDLNNSYRLKCWGKKMRKPKHTGFWKGIVKTKLFEIGSQSYF